MSVISVQTKKFSELEVITAVTGSEQLLIRNDEGVKTITVEDLQKDLSELIDGLRNVIADGAGAHNSIYRGKNLGTAVTAEQYAAISAGTFSGMYIGDYWVINGITYRIAAFDYYYRTGDSECTTHHVVLVPDNNMGRAQMNTENTTKGGYVGSAMYTTNLASVKSTIKSAFSGHVLSKRVYLVNAVSNGAPSGGLWADSEVDLMTEKMVYGCPIFAPMGDGQKDPWGAMHNYTNEKSQLPLFALDPSKITTRSDYWLRDVVTATGFARVATSGDATYGNAGNSYGIRPAFCIA